MKLALRILLRNPGFAAAAVLVLALGIASATAIFSVAYGVLLRDLPYDQPGRLVSVGAKLERYGFPKANAGAADYFDLRARQQVFEDIALTRAVGNYNLTGVGEPERLQGARATASLFSTLRVTPLLGRVFREDEQLDPARASRVAVLSYALWQRRFGGDAGIIGRKIQLNGAPVEVIGVMRPGFHYPSREFELWTPLYYPPQQLQDRLDFSYLSVARLKPGVTLEQARTQMDLIAANLAREYPRTNSGVGVYVDPLLGNLTGAVRPALWTLLAAVGMLFLVGCANLAGLTVARATARQKEFAIRAALGATRGTLARQFLAETFPVAALGAALGVLGARWMLDLMLPFLPASIPRADEIGFDGLALLFAAVLSVAAALLVSLAPALQVSPGIERGPRRERLRDLLIAAEIAGAVVLLVGSSLLMRSFLFVRATSTGFESDRVLSLNMAVDRATHGDDRGVARYLGRLIERVQTVPGVESVGIVNRLPLGGQAQTLSIEFESGAQANIDSRSISEDYFRAIGIPLLAGRSFRAEDSDDRPAVGIIDERVAREVFGSASPLGKRFRISLIPGLPWIEIVGVVGHIRHEGLDTDPRPQVYWPYRQRTQDRMGMVVKTSGPPEDFTAAVRAAIRDVDPNQALYEVRPMTAVVENTLQTRRFDVVLLGAFAAMALLIAAVGLYGVVSHLTARRSREFGIRLALGAARRDVLGMVLKEGCRRAAIGVCAGLAISAAAARLLRSMLFGVGSLDFTSYLLSAGTLFVVAVAAAWLPARRAVRLDPAQTLRSE